MTEKQKVERLASRQHSIVARRQALAKGMTPRMIDRLLANGEWRRILPGVYLVGQATLNFRAKLMAAVLWAGPGAAAAGRSAGTLFGLPHCGHEIEVVTPIKKKNRNGIKLTYDPALEPSAIAYFDNIPATRIARTVFDLCGSLPAQPASNIVAFALRKKLVDLPSLTACLDRRGGPGTKGTKSLRRILVERFAHEVTDSDAEDLFIKMAKRRGLRLTFHHIVRDNGFLAELDFADTTARVDIEIDGDAEHNDPVAKQRDKARDVELSKRGWLVLRFTYWDLVKRTDWVFDAILTAIASRSPRQLSVIDHRNGG